MSGIEAVRAWEHTASTVGSTAGSAPGFSPVAAPVTETLAADSWRVDDGLVLAFDRHRSRFADAVAQAGGDRHEALRAAGHAMAEVPAEGSWSPRLDLTPEGIRLRIRPAPEASGSVTVATAARDPRTLPLRKGPDLAALAVLQAEESARAGVAVEPVITVDGLVAEGGWSALLWWRGDVLCVPAADIPQLPSVTAAVLDELARESGVEVRQERSRPADLEGCEVWLANALRGIRAVDRWIDGPSVAPASRAADWQARLDRLRVAPAVGAR